ncbi:hypothetical protein AMR41_21070 [Hapalosiphon sp. MRB220]|nr:hypothetical protein AMR41_21070 [Hapalosiphon sp. MRB220]
MFVARILANTSTILVVLLLNYGNLLVQPQAVASVKRNCDPIGRVLGDDDRTLKKGSVVCKGSSLNPKAGKLVTILCYQNQKVLQLAKGKVDDASSKCVPQAQVGQSGQCTPQSRGNCPKPKNPGSEEPTIISPYSSVILNPRPSISWHSVSRASSYVVKLEGKGVKWTRETRNTKFAYPSQSEALRFGSTYKLTVLAMSGDSPKSASSYALNMLPNSIAQQISSIVKQVKELNLSPDEEARDLDTIYMSQKLITEAINVLLARINAGTTNPTLHRLLGDRYLEAGFPVNAEQAYTQASILAQSTDNAAELAKAEVGLQRSKLAQQP